MTGPAGDLRRPRPEERPALRDPDDPALEGSRPAPKRDFAAQAPGLRYVGEIKYLPLADGCNLYLATVIDCYSRRLAGWAIADHMRTSLVEDALKAAESLRGSLAGAVFHSDHGAVYTSKAHARLCKILGVTQPAIGAVGTSADNALAESFNATLKREVLQDAACWPDERQAHLPPRGVPMDRALQHSQTTTPHAATTHQPTTEPSTLLRSR